MFNIHALISEKKNLLINILVFNTRYAVGVENFVFCAFDGNSPVNRRRKFILLVGADEPLDPPLNAYVTESDSKLLKKKKTVNERVLN